tara:strand:+ start:920 stop:1543 length:624 start_codon:yes stop_codon:yes gene_type:complete
MKINILNTSGSKAGEIDLGKSVFGAVLNRNAVRQVVLAELSNMRQGTHSSKNRAAVNGGGKKPFKQKGRGAARAGTIRSPLWRGGGTVFGPQPHKYTQKVSKKLSRIARRSILSNAFLEKKIVVVDTLEIESHKTAKFISVLKSLNLINKKVTVVVSHMEDNIRRATKNLEKIFVVQSSKASTYDLIDCECILADKKSIEIFVKILS